MPTRTVELAVAVERDEVSAPFFDAAAAGTLLLRCCPSCRHWFAPQLAWCTSCAGTALEWRPAAGTGRLVAWAVAHARLPGGTDTAPERTLGIVEMDEGPWLHALLRVDDGSGLRRGARVAVEFAHPDGSEPVPVFVPTEGGQS